MKKLCVYLSLVLCMLFLFSGCSKEIVDDVIATFEQEAESSNAEGKETEPTNTEDGEEADPSGEDKKATEKDAQDSAIAKGLQVEKDGSYTSRDEVALYIHTYGKLPGNYITKKEAQRLGWESSKGNLDEVAPGKSIGGSRFGNYENILPEGKYKECDINYTGGYRGAERIIYSEEGDVYYTDDHYNTYTQLY